MESILLAGLLLGLCSTAMLPSKLTFWDFLWAPFLGTLWTIAACDWFSGFYLENSSILYADFIEYCNGVSTEGLLTIGASNKRSAFPMLLPRYFVKDVGVFNALSWAAIYSQIAMGTLLYLWGCLLGGRRLGLSILLLGFVAAPLNFIGRTLSTYPEMSAIFVFGAFTAMWGIKSIQKWPMLLGGIGVGITLLADTRAIVWAIPFFVGLLVAALSRGSGLHRFLRLLLLCIPIYISHQYASEFYVFDAIGLEAQVDMRPSFYHWANVYPPPYEYASNYTWGVKPISELLKTLQFLWEQTQLEVPEFFVSHEIIKGRQIASYYLLASVAGIVLGMIRWRREPWTILALCISVSPFIVTFRGALNMLEEHTRFYIQTLPGLIVLWAVLWEGFVAFGHQFSPFKWTPPSIKHLFSWLPTSFNPIAWIPIWGLLHLILGSYPSPLSPTAEWRRIWKGPDDRFRILLAHYEDGRMALDPNQKPCMTSIGRNIQNDWPLYSTVYDQPLLEYWWK